MRRQATRAFNSFAVGCFDRAVGFVADGEVVTHIESPIKKGELETLRAAIRTAPVVQSGYLLDLDPHSSTLSELDRPEDVPLLARVSFFSQPGLAQERAFEQLKNLLKDDTLLKGVSTQVLRTLEAMVKGTKYPILIDQTRNWSDNYRDWEDTALTIQRRCRQEIDRRLEPSSGALA